MELVVSFLTVLGLGALELWVAVPTGFLLGLDPVLIGVATAGGALSGSFSVAIAGERMRIRLMRHHGGDRGKRKEGSIYRIWSRFGVVGLGLLAPLLTGAPLGTAIGIALGAPIRRLLIWMGVGIVLWSAGLTFAFAVGLIGI